MVLYHDVLEQLCAGGRGGWISELNYRPHIIPVSCGWIVENINILLKITSVDFRAFSGVFLCFSQVSFSVLAHPIQFHQYVLFVRTGDKDNRSMRILANNHHVLGNLNGNLDKQSNCESGEMAKYARSSGETAGSILTGLPVSRRSRRVNRVLSA